MKVVSMNLPLVIELRGSCFQCVRQLQSLTMNNLEWIGNYNFFTLHKLTNISLPKLRSMGNDNFWCMESLTHLELNDVEYIDNGNFRYLHNLETLKMGNLNKNGRDNFEICNGALPYSCCEQIQKYYRYSL